MALGVQDGRLPRVPVQQRLGRLEHRRRDRSPPGGGRSIKRGRADRDRQHSGDAWHHEGRSSRWWHRWGRIDRGSLSGRRRSGSRPPTASLLDVRAANNANGTRHSKQGLLVDEFLAVQLARGPLEGEQLREWDPMLQEADTKFFEVCKKPRVGEQESEAREGALTPCGPALSVSLDGPTEHIMGPDSANGESPNGPQEGVTHQFPIKDHHLRGDQLDVQGE